MIAKMSDVSAMTEPNIMHIHSFKDTKVKIGWEVDLAYGGHTLHSLGGVGPAGPPPSEKRNTLTVEISMETK